MMENIRMHGIERSRSIHASAQPEGRVRFVWFDGETAAADITLHPQQVNDLFDWMAKRAIGKDDPRHDPGIRRERMDAAYLMFKAAVDLARSASEVLEPRNG